MKKLQKTFVSILMIIFLFSACNTAETKRPEEVAYPDSKPLIEVVDEVDDSGRIVWQKPEEVVKILGDISEKTIADIGSGSGYFTFRFALKAKKVIAIDIDPSMIKIVETFKQQLPKDIQSKIETRLAIPSDPLIQKEEADIITIINTIGYIDNRLAYLKKIRDGLKENGEIFILDFKAKNIPINAPEMKYRVPLSTLENDLANAGYTVFSSDDRTLDYQYIIRAKK